MNSHRWCEVCDFTCLPNQLWQGDLTLWNLADGSQVEILNLIDDHSRLLIASQVLARFKAADVLRSFRIRRDRVDGHGKVTLRFRSQLRHIYVGRAHSRSAVHLLVAGADVRIVTTDGLLLRALTLDPARDYQPLGTGRWPVHDVLRQASTMP